MIHSIRWPSKQFSNWLRRHFEEQQRRALNIGINTGIAGNLNTEKDVAGQPNGTDVDEIDVEVNLILSPPPPERSDVPLLQVAVANLGKADLIEAHFRVSLSQYPDYRQEQHLTAADLARSKHQQLTFRLKRSLLAEVMVGHSTLKLSYDLSLRGGDGQVDERRQSYTYDPDSKSFVRDQLPKN